MDNGFKGKEYFYYHNFSEIASPPPTSAFKSLVNFLMWSIDFASEMGVCVCVPVSIFVLYVCAYKCQCKGEGDSHMCTFVCHTDKSRHDQNSVDQRIPCQMHCLHLHIFWDLHLQKKIPNVKEGYFPLPEFMFGLIRVCLFFLFYYRLYRLFSLLVFCLLHQGISSMKYIFFLLPYICISVKCDDSQV